MGGDCRSDAREMEMDVPRQAGRNARQNVISPCHNRVVGLAKTRAVVVPSLRPSHDDLEKNGSSVIEKGVSTALDVN